MWAQSSLRDVLSHLSNTWPSARIVLSSVVRRRSCCLLFPISVSGGASSGLVRTVRGLGLSRRTGRHTISCETWLRACACVRTLAILYEPSVKVAPSVWFGSVHIELNSPPRSPSRLNADDGCVDCRKSGTDVPTFARSAFHNQVDSELVGGATASDTTPTQVAHLSAQVRPKPPTLASRPPRAT